MRAEIFTAYSSIASLSLMSLFTFTTGIEIVCGFLKVTSRPPLWPSACVFVAPFQCGLSMIFPSWVGTRSDCRRLSSIQPARDIGLRLGHPLRHENSAAANDDLDIISTCNSRRKQTSAACQLLKNAIEGRQHLLSCDSREMSSMQWIEAGHSRLLSSEAYIVLL